MTTTNKEHQLKTSWLKRLKKLNGDDLCEFAPLLVLLFIGVCIAIAFIFNVFPSKQTTPEPFTGGSIYSYVDPDTGVNYLVYDGHKNGGLSVRYNSDGTIMVTPTE